MNTDTDWYELVHRYGPLIRSISRRYGLFGADADDVNGAVWLQLVRNRSTIREPAAIAGWLATTARRYCVAHLRQHSRYVHTEPEEIPVNDQLDSRLMGEERHAALVTACAQLPDRDQVLLSLVFADPPVPYTEISARTGMPVGSIGPTRQRCLARLRRLPEIAALADDLNAA
jgi:RNA polymerase sigma factor (sigma-70 family)